MDSYVVVAMDDPVAAARAARADLPVVVTELPTTPLGLPLAAARNRGARQEIQSFTDLSHLRDHSPW